MKRRKFGFVALMVWLVGISVCKSAYSQPNADFSSDAAACQQQNIRLKNLSTGANSYEWDFCADDALTIKSQDVTVTLGSMQGGYGFKLLQDNGAWYGFAISQANHSIIRLDYGNSPIGLPSVTNLGNPGSVLQLPQGIDIIKAGTNWVGFVGFSNNDAGFVRLDFGTSLTNTPTATNVGMFGLTGRMWDVKLVSNSSGYYLTTVNRDNNSFVRISFGSSFLNSVSAGNVFESTIPAANLLLGLDVIQIGSVWKAVLADYSGNKITQLNLGSSLSSTTSTVEGNYTFPSFSNPFRIRLVREGNSYRAMVASNGALVTVVDLKDMNPVNTPVQISHPTIPIMIGIDVIRWSGKTILNGVSFYDQKVNRVVFEQDCGASVLFATTDTPPDASYSQSGSKVIELKAIDVASAAYSVKAISTVVSSLVSPDINFTSTNSCALNPINFTSINSSGAIASYLWKFGDAQTDTQPNTSHSYSVAGNYVVDLTITGTNSCQNFKSQTLSVFNPPVANFQLPSASPVCTNQDYVFNNTSTFDAASNPQWEWRLNGTLLSSQLNFNATFASASAQQIKLKVLIPGCENEVTKNISTVLVGPVVNFSAVDNCQGTSVSFVNLSSGVDAGYQWNFGDASTSTAASPSHTYATAATFQASLTGSNAAGCQNVITKPLKIYTKPVPDFSIGLPPFSCNGTSTPFQNTTPALTDSNITTWAWQFGDMNISNQQNPNHTYLLAGNYNASLTATSDKGCVGTLTKGINIAASPVADFTVGPACLNQSTKFTDISSGGIQTRSWQIASSIFTTPNPTYTFNATGNYSATLTVTSANACSSFKTKQISIAPIPNVDFLVSNACANHNAVFTDITTSPQDVVVGTNWNFEGNSIAGNPASYNFVNSGSNNVKLTTTHLSGCKYTLSRNVLINVSPVANFTASADRGSAPLIVQFANTSQQATSYVWKFYDKVTATSTQVSPAYTFISLGDYSAELTATNTLGCSDVKTIPIKVLVPSIDLSMSDFTLTPDPTTGKLKAIVTIVNNSNIPVTTAEVSLILAEKAVVNETLVVNLVPGQSATRTLSFTISPNQFDFSFLCASIISEKDVSQENNRRCLNLNSNDYFFNPYPNPSDGIIQVDWVSVTAGKALITVFDSMGKTIYASETLSTVGLNQAVLDLSVVSGGLYYVRVETSGSKKTMRFIRR
ncbi:MAG: PKD domain-containing protein [Cyclobacteriaceae bacterium]|nr:PKD domain-containing protein [Cyclobacteriaceae bacterium]